MKLFILALIGLLAISCDEKTCGELMDPRRDLEDHLHASFEEVRKARLAKGQDALYMYYPEKEGLWGVDLNKNGLRDDHEYFIDYVAQDEVHKELLKRYSLSLEESYKKRYETGNWDKELYVKTEKALKCIDQKMHRLSNKNRKNGNEPKGMSSGTLEILNSTIRSSCERYNKLYRLGRDIQDSWREESLGEIACD